VDATNAGRIKKAGADILVMEPHSSKAAIGPDWFVHSEIMVNEMKRTKSEIVVNRHPGQLVGNTET